MKRKWTVNDTYFDYIDNPIKAYLLGFFLADGNITLANNCKNSWVFRVQIVESDKNIIECFRNEIIKDRPIIYKIGSAKNAKKRRQNTYSIKWTSLHMKDQINKLYNITPRKTYNNTYQMNFTTFDKRYIFDFIHGYFDGDGCNSILHNKNGTLNLSFQFYSTSSLFLEQIASIFEDKFKYLTHKISGQIKKNVCLYCLMFHTHNHKQEFIEDVVKLFYMNKSCYLERKKNKFLEYLKFKYRDNPEDYERFLDIVERRVE